MRSHTGGAMSFGHGTIHCRSSKQKLNTKSSTEAELVGISDYLPYNLWMKMFLEEQGYALKSNTLFQDNQSTIRMATNGRTSCTGNSRHIDVRYFFVVDRVKKKEIQVKYCPTEMMVADYFTKPLQGKLFHTIRDIIMGNTSIFEMIDKYFPLKERVGNHDDSEKEEKERKKTSVQWNTSEENSTGCENENTVPETSNESKPSWADIVKASTANDKGNHICP